VAKPSNIRRVAWLTDIHLEFLKPPQIDAFLDQVAEVKADALLITGDIAQAPMLRKILLHMAHKLITPVYIVLGNHDFYRDDIGPVRAEMAALTRKETGVVWMPAAGIVDLAPGVVMLGHDGWSDGRYGDFMRSPIVLNDYLKIAHLKTASTAERWKRLKALGDEAGDYLRGLLPEAARRADRVVVLTHPPPFREACWFEGRIPGEDDPYLPHFTCKAVGDALLNAADSYPDTEFTVLCGHVHHAGEVSMRDNLHVLTGGATYEKPTVQRVFEFPLAD
jgi:Icc-related predicted phosphoesterase